MPWAVVKPVIDYKMRVLCRKAYPNHPHGCPNWGKKEGCPPSCKPIDKLLDFDKPVWAVWSKFNIHDHVERMRSLHPEWTDRQLNCCLYWQPKARQVLKREVTTFLSQHIGIKTVTCPEASGVVLTPTMAQVGIELEWPPKNWTYQIILAGVSYSDPDSVM